jgi:hypothetical protein
MFFVLTWIVTLAPNTFAIGFWLTVLVITVALLPLTYRKYSAQGESF